MDLHGIDLNLLVAFNALMEERNVTRAASQVGVSQPAMSAALSRLRKLLGDTLFLRSPNGLLPTPRARELAQPIAQALTQIKTALLATPAFMPAEAVFTMNLGLSDYPAFVLLPKLLQMLSERAPNLTINVHAFNDRDHAVDMLDAGVIDAAIGVLPSHQDGRIFMRPILHDVFVTLVAHDHPAARRGMDMDTYLALPHVLVSPEGERYGVVDQALAQLGKQRTLALTLPQMFAVPAIIASSRMTATVLKRIALSSPTGGQLVLFPPPIALPEIVFHLIWHRRGNGKPAQDWFREMIEKVASEL